MSGGWTKRRARRRAGYTLIEAMMAVGVLMAGSVAVMAMHQAATRGNMEARQIAMGNQIAQRWVERLRRDSLNWTRSSNNAADPTLLIQTTYLREVPAVDAAPTWFVPVPPETSHEAAQFDYQGQDLVTVGGARAAHYCANVRLQWVYPGQAMRADVRVWWPRRGAGALLNCAPGVDPNTLTNDRRVQMVYTSTIVRYTSRPG
jgi:Tfp pilus assembly protein PilV